MANREENIKKINEALEQLSDEELEKVAGGRFGGFGTLGGGSRNGTTEYDDVEKRAREFEKEFEHLKIS